MTLKLAIAAALCLALLLTGCHGARETEDVAFITAFGIDRETDGKYKVTYSIEIPRAVGSAGGGGPVARETPAVVGNYVAPSMAEARNLLTATMSRFSSASHLKAVVIGEEVARAGITDIIGPLTRFREYRGTIFVFVAQGRAEDFINNNVPKIDLLPSKWYESIMVSAQESDYYMRCDLHEIYLGLKNPGRAAHAAYVAVNPLSGHDRPSGPRPPGTRADPYVAGDIPRAGTGNPVDIAGLAVFAGDRLAGVLSTADARTIAILQGRYRDGRIVIDDPLQPDKFVNIHLRNGAKPDIAATLKGDRAAFRVAVFLEAELSGTPSGIGYEHGEYRKLLEDRISAIITRDIGNLVSRTQNLGSDVFGFGLFLRSRFATYAQMEAAGLDELYRTATVEVSVKTTLRRSGLMWRTSPVKQTTAGLGVK